MRTKKVPTASPLKPRTNILGAFRGKVQAMPMNAAQLAVKGGPKAVTIAAPEQWKRPVDKEMELIAGLLETGAISGSGPGSGLPDEFENQFKDYIGAEYCLLTDHGSTALAAGFYAAGVGPGDEIITPTIGYLGTYGGALHMGARPVFCEPDPKTLLADPADIEKRITPRTRAICPIHAGGNVCDMEALLAIGEKYGVAIVEDGAHIHGAEWDGKKIGSFGDICCFSLQGANPGGKPVCGGEGGIATTNNRLYYERMLAFAHLHRNGVAGEFTIHPYTLLDNETLGQKLRAHPLAMAIAKVSLDSLDYRIEKSDAFRETLFAGIEQIPGLRPEATYPKANRISLYGGLNIIYDAEHFDDLPAARFVEALQTEGVPCRLWGWHLEHLRKIFTEGFDLWGEGRGPLGDDFVPYKRGGYPIAEDTMTRTISVSSYLEPRGGFVAQMIAGFQKVAANYKQLID
jgi:perosamine synthetase